MQNPVISYRSILNDDWTPPADTPPMPCCFPDLHLDGIESAFLADEPENELEAIFRTPPGDLSIIRYRQALFADLAAAALREGLTRFSITMREVRRYLGDAQTLHQPEQRDKWKLDAAARYCDALQQLNTCLGRNLSSSSSPALQSFHLYLQALLADPAYLQFDERQQIVSSDINAIRYSLCLDGKTLFVEDANGSDDLCATLRQTFSQVVELPAPEEIRFFKDLEMSPLEVRILEQLRQRHAAAFAALSHWSGNCPPFPAPDIAAFERELRFYLAWLSLMDTISKKGLPVCLPVVSAVRTLRIQSFYDLSLALEEAVTEVVPNDCLLGDGETCMVLTGPNQGGKTTYARALGQLVYLATLGCPVPAHQAEVFHCDAILTHFAVAEDPLTQSGRLREELLRVRPILRQATTHTLILLNELFSTTTTQDALLLGNRVLSHLAALGSPCLYVTHLPELANEAAGIVSLVAAVEPDDTSRRTFRILRRSADGLAYAQVLAAAHGLGYQQVRQRILEKTPVKGEENA